MTTWPTLDAVRETALGCTLCPLAETRTQVVFGVGDPHADLMFVGQNISNNTARPIEVLSIVALIYFAIAFPLTRAVTVIEQRILKRLAV